jgi:hypothetical protein
MTKRPLWREGTKQAVRRLAEERAVQQAQLADMPHDVIVAYLRERGYAVVQTMPELPTAALQCNSVRRVYDHLPAGYPPWADDDE